MISGDVLKYLNGFAVAMRDNYEPARKPSNLSDSAYVNLKQVVKAGDLRMHPVITHLVDKETLTNMGAEPVGWQR
jgi:hypothetical protein